MITRYRLGSLLLDQQTGPVSVTDQFGALQGQDLPGVITSLALRNGGNRQEVIDAFNDGHLVRTWPQRGTLHVVSADRLREILSITRSRTNIDRYLAERGISPEQMERATVVAGELLETGPATRKELIDAWKRQDLCADQTHSRALLVKLHMDATITFGPLRGKDQMAVLVDSWIPAQELPEREDIIDGIVRRYVETHSPTTFESLKWWSALPGKDLWPALKRCGYEVSDDGYLWAHNRRDPVSSRSLFMLPPFDEFMLGYTDRNISIPPGFESHIHNGFGVFTGSIVYGGTVIGTWRRQGTKVTPHLFSPVSQALQNRIDGLAQSLPL